MINVYASKNTMFSISSALLVLSLSISAPTSQAEELKQEKLINKQENANLAVSYVQQGGLTWMQYGFKKNWSAANSYCTNMKKHGPTSWRLPTKDELVALDNSGAIANKEGWGFFFFWSATSDGVGRHDGVDLLSGNFGSDVDTIEYYVMCVR
jgi:hypothetical protein